MVGLKISSSELKDIMDILGLAEDKQGVVYINLLSLGMATLGQLSLVSGIDFIQTQEALNILIGSNLVKRIPGKVGRYIALQPFLKAFFLSYDPITLFNIRKESKEVFEKNSELLHTKVDRTNEKFQEHTSNLIQNFSENLKPITTSFSTISLDQQNLVTSINETIQSDIQFVKDQMQTIIEKASDFYEQLNDENISELEKIPVLFNNNIPVIKKSIQNVQYKINSSLEEIRTRQIKNADKINKEFGENILRHMNENQRILENFNNNLAKNRENLEEFTFKTKNKLESIRNDAKATKPKFEEFHASYNEMEQNLKILFSSIPSKLNNIENVISDLITEIKSRKMFRGKDEFIDQLKLIQEEKAAIFQQISSSMEEAELLNKLNHDLIEIEGKIINATDLGVDSTINLFEERRKVFREQLNLIENEFKLNLGKEVNDSLLTVKNGINEQIMSLKTDSDKLLRTLVQDLELESENSTKFFSEILMKSINEFKQEVKVNFENRKSKAIEENALSQKITAIIDLSKQVNNSLNNTSRSIIDFDTSLNSYFSDLTTFTTNYANEQLNMFVSNLNETKLGIDEFVLNTERQLEAEVSALIFSIKEMKQKLNKITNVMSTVELSELDPSLLDTDLVIGEPVIIMLLRDLTVRTKSSLTILMPRPELQTLITASKLPFKTRVTIIGDFIKVPKTTLKKVISSSNIRLKQLDGIEFWGCIRDAEELLICPEPTNLEKEELVGVITTNGHLVDLFTQEIITYTTRSREILPSDLE